MSAADLYVEPLLGWRVWHVRRGRGGEPRLLSWSQRGEWPARGRMEARCRRLVRGACAAVPRPGHTCGVYAARKRELAESLLNELPPLVEPVAIGLVSLWGRVIENLDGWRAQYAYPYDLELLNGDVELAHALRRRYQVDVRVSSS